ncbi:MAG: acetolactate synthase large subunit [Myxococcota bacterium]|nr:acetolactate synthase large subunit [Myxococcota bacterium]
MNGAESLIRTALAAGSEVCFANPGTTEMPLVAALDAVPAMRSVLGLFEGVCTGAADGYGRMTGKPALTLLHLGPGFANGIANLHNARRAHSPVLNVIGDQATWHLAADAPLTSDIESLARPVSGHVATSARASDLSGLTARAIEAARTAPGCVSTLIVPADCQWEDADEALAECSPPARAAVDEAAVADAARALEAGNAATLLVGGAALSDRGLEAAARIAAQTGCRVFIETFPGRQERGAHLAPIPRLPYFPEQVVTALEGTKRMVLAGARAPVAFFAYVGVPSTLTPEGCQPVEWPLGADVEAGLEALAERLGAKPVPVAAGERPEVPAGAKLDPATLGQTLAALQPEGAIVVDEAATSGAVYASLAGSAPPHTTLGLTGGAIGQGMPCATGAAVACPDRKVISFQADGSGMYTLQSLWTQAREGLDVLTILCANRSYRILRFELGRAGIVEPGPVANALTDLGNPVIDWVSLARGLGVSAERAETTDELAAAIRRGLAEPGPSFVEAVLA